MKQFDLEKALAGEPVKLRNGSKAYVKYVMPDGFKGKYPLIGYYIKGNRYIQYSWTIHGSSRVIDQLRNEDIVSMWQAPRPRVQLDLPAPLKEQQEDMWYIVGDSVAKSDVFNSTLLDTGKYFATREDAEEWLNALKGARR